MSCAPGPDAWRLRARMMSPALPAVCCARATAAARPSLRARSLPPVRPQGAPCSSRCCATENNPSTKKRGLACGASRRVVLHRRAERGEPKAVKAKPFGRAMRGLDGFELGGRSTISKGNAIKRRAGLQAPKFRPVCRRPAAAVKPGGRGEGFKEKNKSAPNPSVAVGAWSG